MEAEPQRDGVRVSMTQDQARDLLRELDKWPDLPKVERDLVDALKELPSPSSERVMVVDTQTMSELTELERRYWEALRNQDAEAAADMTADLCVVAGASGVAAIDRSTFASMMNDASWRLEEFELTDVDVQHLLDDVAVVAYRVREELTVEGLPLTLEAADVSVWVRSADGWRCAVHTESILGDPFGRDRQRQ